MDFSYLKSAADNNKTMDLEKELTNKYLSGELSFAEYSSEWYENDDEEDMEEVRRNEDEPQQSSSAVEKSVQKRNRRVTRLSPALMGLMGEANLRFARGETETAEKMCHEIIKQVPTASEPYQTLAQIYEHDKEKNLQLSLIAAHLGPADANEWLRLAALCKERVDYRQEMICYTRAIRAQPHNIEIHMKRLEFIAKLEEMSYPVTSLSVSRVKCYYKIVTSLPASDGETIMKYAKMAATIYHNSNEIERALEVLATAYKKCSTLFAPEDLNIFLELLIAQRQFDTCLQIFVANAGVDIEADILTVKNDNGEIEEQTNYTKCSIPNNLPIDLRCKLLICFINLGALNLFASLIRDFMAKYNVAAAGDLYMDIEEVLSSQGYYDMAFHLLDLLVKHDNYDLGAVWLRHAECLHNLGRKEEAVSSYYKVLEYAPQHADARKKLFEILERNGNIDDALQILQQDYHYIVSASLLYEQCCCLKKYNRLEKYIEAGEALLSRTFARFRHVEELKLALRAKGASDHIQTFRTVRGENPSNEDDIQFDDDEGFIMTSDQEWDFFTDLFNVAYKLKQYIPMQRLAFGALTSKNLSTHRSQIEFYCLQACNLNNDHQKAFRFIKDFSTKLQSSRSWNLLNLTMNNLEENTHCKFLSRLFQRKEFSSIKCLFMGNNFLNSGRYLVALKYFLEHHNQCKEPLTALLIAITILVMASQRTVDKHNNLVLQGIAYLLTYQNLRKCDQETYYNLGRAYQMLSINNLAVEYYEKALVSNNIAHCDQHGDINLTKETAYNLYLVYKENSPQIARKYLLKYLVIE